MYRQDINYRPPIRDMVCNEDNRTPMQKAGVIQSRLIQAMGTCGYTDNEIFSYLSQQWHVTFTSVAIEMKKLLHEDYLISKSLSSKSGKTRSRNAKERRQQRTMDLLSAIGQHNNAKEILSGIDAIFEGFEFVESNVKSMPKK